MKYKLAKKNIKKERQKRTLKRKQNKKTKKKATHVNGDSFIEYIFTFNS